MLRPVSTVLQLRLIVATPVRSSPGMGHVFLFMAIMLYIYAVPGFHLFHDEILRELERTRDALARLRSRLEAFPAAGPGRR